MKTRLCFAVALLVTTTGAVAGPATPKPQELFYRAPAGNGTAIVAAARDGSNTSTLLTSGGPMTIDVGSGSSGVMAVSTSTGLQLLTYAKNSSGVFARTGLTTLVPGVMRATALDISPDGTRIAYRGGDGNHLMVYTIADGSTVEWASGNYVWDVVWARDGASIVYVSADPTVNVSHLYEVTAPGQVNDVFDIPNIDRVEVSRLNGNVLLLSYNNSSGQAVIGTWQLPSGTSAGGWINPSISDLSVANRGVFSCDDSYLIAGSSGHAGAQIWYTRTLPSGSDLLINKVGANAEPQSWSSCPSTALQFRVVRH